MVDTPYTSTPFQQSVRQLPPSPLCPFGTPLWQCNRYPGVEFVYQPTAPGPIPANIIGHVTTWDPNWQYPPPTKPTTTDIAAAFADNNTIRRDGSLPDEF